MSSEMPGLANLGYRATYREVLDRDLPDRLRPYADFFADTRRLETLAAILDAHLPGRAVRVLNVGSGPFATEIFVAALQESDVLALDYTTEYAALVDRFQADGYLKGVRVRQADITTEDFGQARFDLIILHDILYEKALDLHTLVPRLAEYLAPGGYLYLDFVSTRTAWIWKAFGKPDRFARYDPDRVRATLAAHGLDVVDWRPSAGAAAGPARALHRLLALVGTSNIYAALARRAGAPDD